MIGFQLGKRVVIRRPNGEENEPRELRGVIVMPPLGDQYSAYPFVRLDGRTIGVPFLAEFVTPLGAVDLLAELAEP